TTTRAGRGWVWRSSATARARAAPVRPAMRRQGSPSAKDFASASKAGHSLNIDPSTLRYHVAGAGPAWGKAGDVGVETTTPHASRPAPPCPQPGPSAGGLGEIEREGFELDREVDVLEAHVFGNLDPGWRKIQDGLDARSHQLIGNGLGRLRRHRDDRDLDPARLHFAAEVPGREDRRRVNLARHLARVLVEDRRDPEPLTREPFVMKERRAEIAEADQSHRPLAIEAEDPLELGLQTRD